MIDIVEKNKCSGCTACYNSCPVNCISMEEDSEGFYFPKIDNTKCIKCNKCENACPVLFDKASKLYETEKVGYIVQNKNKKNLYVCSSGGFVNSVLRKLSKKGYYTCGAIFDKDFSVCHTIIPPGSDPKAFSGSKYVQSFLGDTFSSIKSLLDDGKKVCFVGTGCQVEGLILFLGKKYENLLTIDLVCHGVPSPMIWKRYREYLEKKYNSKIVSVNFRDKSLGYQLPCMRIDFENGKKYQHTARVDIMLKSFFSHASLRQSCFNCPSKGKKRVGDLLVYDCWNSKELIESDNNMGYTAVIAYNTKGQDAVKDIEDICSVHNVPVDNLIPTDGGMIVNSAKYRPYRKNYINDVKNGDLKKVFVDTLNVTLKDHIIEEIKILFGSSRIFYAISK